ncbi:MAG: hypothetical protein ACQERD_02470 [Campylobacterota bacterium]
MLQVNKKIKKIALLVFVSLVFTSCSTKDIKVKDAQYKTRVYHGVSKDAIFEAAKKIFIYAGDRKFLIDSYRNSMTVIKPKVNHYPLYTYTTEDIWDLNIKQKDNVSTTKLEIKRVVDFDEKNPIYFKEELYELFYTRLEYLLGIKTKWYSCVEYRIKFNDDEALCDIDLDIVSTPTKDDIVKDIYITERADRKLDKIAKDKKDLLAQDVVLTMDDKPQDDILSDAQEKAQDNSEMINTLDKEINALDKRVNDNLDKTLEKIEEAQEE